LKLTTDRYEASLGLFATAELLVLVKVMFCHLDDLNDSVCLTSLWVSDSFWKGIQS